MHCPIHHSSFLLAHIAISPQMKIVAQVKFLKNSNNLILYLKYLKDHYHIKVHAIYQCLRQGGINCYTFPNIS